MEFEGTIQTMAIQFSCAVKVMRIAHTSATSKPSSLLVQVEIAWARTHATIAASVHEQRSLFSVHSRTLARPFSCDNHGTGGAPSDSTANVQ